MPLLSLWFANFFRSLAGLVAVLSSIATIFVVMFGGNLPYLSEATIFSVVLFTLVGLLRSYPYDIQRVSALSGKDLSYEESKLIFERPPKFGIVGLSGVGKSSLVENFTNRQDAEATRDVYCRVANFYCGERHMPVVLVDTAGSHIFGQLAVSESCDALVALFDWRCGCEDKMLGEKRLLAHEVFFSQLVEHLDRLNWRRTVLLVSAKEDVWCEDCQGRVRLDKFIASSMERLENKSIVAKRIDGFSNERTADLRELSKMICSISTSRPGEGAIVS